MLYSPGCKPVCFFESAEKSANGKINSEIVNGNQPDNGRMTITHLRRNVEGYPDYDTIQMNFEFNDGIQTVSV